MNEIKSPQHNAVKKVLRIGGPIIFAVGGLLTLVGVGSFFVCMVTQSGPPVLFVCAFIGLPLMFVGGAMCMFGYVGAFSRYIAAEQAPVAKDTINYLAEGTQDAVRTAARTAAHGVAEGIRPPQNTPPEQK
jgi:hypothetical protein